MLILILGGKSAIMTGIVVGLGGKARSTERGSSLKQFIRTGATSGRVIVHLRNRGLEAYKPEEYGNVIVIERLIKDDGSGQYKIKSERGECTCTCVITCKLMFSNQTEELVVALSLKSRIAAILTWNIELDLILSLPFVCCLVVRNLSLCQFVSCYLL